MTQMAFALRCVVRFMTGFGIGWMLIMSAHWAIDWAAVLREVVR